MLIISTNTAVLSNSYLKCENSRVKIILPALTYSSEKLILDKKGTQTQIYFEHGPLSIWVKEILGVEKVLPFVMPT